RARRTVPSDAPCPPGPCHQTDRYVSSVHMSDQGRSGAAERLLDTAARLFYARGVSNVGINEIIARAGVARMTLYHHFPSKDALIKAVLERRTAERDEWLD